MVDYPVVGVNCVDLLIVVTEILGQQGGRGQAEPTT
jgi:hypothetical protein